MKPVKRSVALAIFEGHDPPRVLAVRRPHDDEDLPDAWGLPAATLQNHESWADAARRAGREKLGLTLNPGPELNRGHAERAGYTLQMRLLEATIQSGEPHVPQPTPGVTQYTEWRWDSDALLEPAAARGSLCCRLFLQRVKSKE